MNSGIGCPTRASGASGTLGPPPAIGRSCEIAPPPRAGISQIFFRDASCYQPYVCAQRNPLAQHGDETEASKDSSSGNTVRRSRTSRPSSIRATAGTTVGTMAGSPRSGVRSFSSSAEAEWRSLAKEMRCVGKLLVGRRSSADDRKPRPHFDRRAIRK